MNLVFYVFIHFLFRLLPPRHLIHHYLSQQQSVSIIVFMHLCLHTFPFSPTSSMTSYSPLSVTKQRVSYYCVYECSLLCLHTFPFSPTSSTTSYSPLSVTTTESKLFLCLHTFPFSPTSSTTSYSPLQQQDVSILVFMHLNVFIHFLFHLLPPRHLIHHYLSQQQPVSILVLLHLNVFIHFLFHLLPPRHLITTICHKTGSKLLLCL